jgi:predicted DNA-binding protein (UPF0251 family)
MYKDQTRMTVSVYQSKQTKSIELLDTGLSMKKPRKFLTVEEVAAVRAEVAAGVMQMDVAAKYGIHKTTVSRIVGSTRRAPRITQVQRRAVIRDYLAGESLKEIAVRNELDGSTVSRILDRQYLKTKGGFVPYMPHA